MRFNKKYQRGMFLLILLLIIISSITIIKNIPKNDSSNGNNISMSNPDDPYESNDDFYSAKDITSEKLKWLKLVQEDDDWFRFDIFPGFERLIVKVIFSNAEGDINIQLWDNSFSFITGSYSGDDGEFIDYNITLPGTYRLKIYGWNNGNPYELLWDALNSSISYDDNYEPNNNDIEAGINADLSSNKGVWLSSINGLGVQRNLDYFKIDVDPTNRRLFVEVIFDHYFDNIDVEIWDSTLTVLITEGFSFTHNEYINWVVSSSGIYYILIKGYNWSNTYDLRWDTGPIEDNYEENDYFTSAYDLSSYDAIWLSTIDGPGIQTDDDWYKINVNNDEKRLLVDLKFRYRFGDINLEIVDEWGGWIVGSWFNRDGEYIDYILPSGGIYYIHILGYNAGNIYDFWWEDLSHDDWLEKDDFGIENDDFSRARRIEPRYYPDLKIINYDEDWYKIDLDSGDDIDINIYYDNWEGVLFLELYDPSNHLELGSYHAGGYENIDYTVDESGEWRIRIYRDSGDFNIDVFYSLEIWVNGMQAGDDPYEFNNWMDSAYFLRDYEGKWLSKIHGLAVQGDEDWYMIDVTPGFEHLMVNLSITYGFGNIWFTICNEYGNDIDDSYSTSYGEHFDSTISYGIYFIRVYGDNSGIEYNLWWDDLRTDTRLDDNYEENDDPTTAYDLSQWEHTELRYVNGYGLQYDNDWYRIAIDSGRTHLNVYLTYDYQEGPIGVEIYKWDYSKITSNFTMKDNEFISYKLPSNGTYYVRIIGDTSGNVYNLVWSARESYDDEMMIPGYNILIMLSAIFGVATIITVKLKRSKTNQ